MSEKINSEASIDELEYGSRIALKELNRNGNMQHSPLNTKTGAITKSASTSISSSAATAASNSHQGMPNIAAAAAQQQTLPAAGTASEQFNSSLDSSKVHQELSLNKDFIRNSNRLSNKFVGLTEFDEADIPELLDDFEGNSTQDPLKLSFEEGILPTFPADFSTNYNSVNGKRSNESIDITQLQVPTIETDTAVSSDNEIYAECHSYRDSELNFELPPMDLSDREHYRSALNSQNTTLNEDEVLGTTLDNIASALVSEENLTPKSTTTVSIPLYDYYNCEPMDVDTTLELSNSSQNTTVEADHLLLQRENGVDKDDSFDKITLDLESDMPKATESEMKHTISSESTPKLSLPTVEIQSSPSISPTSSIVELEKKANGDCHISNDSFLVKQTTSTLNCTSSNTNDGSGSSITQERRSISPVTVTSTTNIGEVKPNLTIDIRTVSINNSAGKSPQVLPTFPIKPIRDVTKFPPSPTKIVINQPDFAGNINKTPESIGLKNHSPRPQTLATPAGLFASNSISPSNPVNVCNNTLNSNTNTTPEQFPVQTNTDKRHTFTAPTTPNASLEEPSEALDTDSVESIEKRRTFNVSPSSTNSQSLTAICAANNALDDSSGNRRTFNLNQPTPLNTVESTDSLSNITRRSYTVETASEALKQLDTSCEAMDIDESYTLPPDSELHATAALNQQAEPTLEQQQPTTPPSRSPPPTTKRSSPLSMILSRPTICSAATAAAAKILSQSPPSLTKPFKLDMEDIDIDVLKMPPPTNLLFAEKKRTSLKMDAAAGGEPMEKLSAKEQTKSNTKDEKDVFVEKFTPSPVEEIFASSVQHNDVFGVSSNNNAAQLFGIEQCKNDFQDEDFSANSDLILQQSDFEFLLTKGSNNVQIDRSSLLLRFDPLLGVPVPINNAQQKQQALQQILQKANVVASSSGTNISSRLKSVEDNDNKSIKSSIIEEETETQVQVQGDTTSGAKLQDTELQQQQTASITQLAATKKHANMSVDVIKDINIDNDCNKVYEHSNSQSEEKESNFKMDELEKKIKNEVLKTEDIEKKLKEAEQREESLIKRITEKDKTITKMNGVIEAYEKSVAELLAEKEQLAQSYEKQLTEIKTDRDSNYHHLMSLETTFSDLHVKYEKSKEMTSQLKTSEEALLAEKRQNLENLRLQEQRYEKMKNHAMQQLEIANKKLELMKKEHVVETTKLKAQLKKEEISRASINEQLQQKSRENEELVKICDELINGQGS